MQMQLSENPCPLIGMIQRTPLKRHLFFLDGKKMKEAIAKLDDQVKVVITTSWDIH
jgi:hypothetical protein